jgi:ribosome maturation factor RimP
MRKSILEYLKGKYVSVLVKFKDPKTGQNTWNGRLVDFDKWGIILDTASDEEDKYKFMVIPKMEINDILMFKQQY